MLVISFKVTEQAQAAIETVANGQGLRPALWCRMVALREAGAAAEQPRLGRRVADAALLRDILAELGRQGSNLNQLARRLNTGAGVALIVEDLGAMRGAYETALHAVANALGVEKAP